MEYETNHHRTSGATDDGDLGRRDFFGLTVSAA